MEIVFRTVFQCKAATESCCKKFFVAAWNKIAVWLTSDIKRKKMIRIIFILIAAFAIVVDSSSLMITRSKRSDNEKGKFDIIFAQLKFSMYFLPISIKVFCKDASEDCEIFNQNISSEDYVLDSPLNENVIRFIFDENINVKYLPKQVGEKFPNLKTYRSEKCGLTIVRNFNFKNMQNLELLLLRKNQIAKIEAGSFDDLTKVTHLQLDGNLIETLDENIFAKMIKVEKIALTSNKIKTLSPTTFNIPGAILNTVFLGENVCINEYYYENYNMNVLESDLRKKCGSWKWPWPFNSQLNESSSNITQSTAAP